MRFELCLAGLLLSGTTWALDSHLSLQQLNHRSWTAAHGAPGSIEVIAQTADGLLWLGSRTGLFRFDGMQFVRYTGPAAQPFESTDISALAAWDDSGLWIGFRFGGIAVLKDGNVTSYGEREGLPSGTVKSIVRDHDGVVWAATRGGLARLVGSRWELVPLDPSEPRSPALAALVDGAGTLWVMTIGRVLALPRHESRFREIAKRPATVYVADMPLAVGPDDKVWAAPGDKGLMVMNAAVGAEPLSTPAFPELEAGGLLFDREGNLWLANRAIQRFIPAQATQSIDTFTESNGLSGVPFSLLEDREGNIWVTTSGGLDRFSHSNIARVQLPQNASWPALAAGEAGSIWLAYTTTSTNGGIAQIRNSAVSAPRYAGQFTCAYRDRDGSIWFAGATSLAHLVGTQIHTTPAPDEALNSEVQAMARDSTGAMWMSIAGAGLFRQSNGRWTPYGDLAALPRMPAIVATADESGVMWFGYTKNRIARVAGSSVQIIGVTEGLKVGNVTAVQVRGRDVWIGGELGLAHFDGTRVSTITAASAEPFTGISGIVATSKGDLWLNGNDGVAHVKAADLARAIQDSTYRVPIESFTHLDGVPGPATQVRPLPSAIEGTDGRLWFTSFAGVFSIDPTRIRRNSVPPPVTIHSVSAGTTQYSLAPAALHLPVHTTNLQIQFSAGSLTIPERVQFRCKLDGFDKEWQDAGNRREAFYTNLWPGRYTFRVIAANNDGVWNDVGASQALTIKPAFYQTKWFFALCTLMGLTLLHSLHQLRLKQVGAQVRGRLEERLAERVRIARELHDTLLQSIQGLILRFHAIAERVPQREPTREQMERALVRAEEALDEARNRVQNLRAAEDSTIELSLALAAAGEQLAQGHAVQFRVSVEGTPRTLHPIVREEALLIAREALTNALRHANARNVEAEVSYGTSEMHVRVRDDGAGIDAEVLNIGGRVGHWGLEGMRERTRKIRARLSIWSKPDAGTEIDLCVSAEVAYTTHRARRWWTGWPKAQPFAAMTVKIPRFGNKSADHEQH